MTTTKRCAIYARVSTDRQQVQNQLAEVQQLAVARGYEPVVYEEVESAAKARPVLDRMLADVRAGRVHAVAVWALDRLHRSMSLVLSCSATQPKIATKSGRTGPLVSSQPSRTESTGTPSRSAPARC